MTRSAPPGSRPRAIRRRRRAAASPAPPWTFEALLRELVDEQTYPRLHRLAWSAPPERRRPAVGTRAVHVRHRHILDGVQALIDRVRPESAGSERAPRVPGRAAQLAPGAVASQDQCGIGRAAGTSLSCGCDSATSSTALLDVGAQRGAEPRVIGPAGVVGGEHEAVREPPAEVAHVTVAGVHQHQRRLVAAPLGGVPRRPAHHLGQIGGEPLGVPRILARMRERMVQLGVGQAAFMQRGGEWQERALSARELVQRRRRLHRPSIARPRQPAPPGLAK